MIFHENQASMCLGPIRIKGEVRTTKKVNDLKYCFTDRSKVVSFVDPFCYLFHVCLYNTVLTVHCNLEITCWERADIFALLCAMFSFPIWCLGSGHSGVVLDCVNS